MNGAAKPKGSYTELKVDSNPQHVRGFSSAAILKPNVSSSMFH